MGDLTKSDFMMMDQSEIDKLTSYQDYNNAKWDSWLKGGGLAVGAGNLALNIGMYGHNKDNLKAQTGLYNAQKDDLLAEKSRRKEVRTHNDKVML